MVFVLDEHKYGIKTGSLRTVARNSEIQDGEDVEISIVSTSKQAETYF